MEAKKKLELFVEETEKLVGKEHREYAIVQINLAGIYDHIGEYDTMGDLHMIAYNIIEKSKEVNPEYELDITLIYCNQGIILGKFGDSVKALSYLNTGFISYARRFSNNHPYMIRIMYVVALQHSKSEQYEISLQILNISIDTNGYNCSETAYIIYLIANRK